VPWFGKLGLERDVAAAEAGAARSDYESTRRDLALAAATLYSQYYVATRSLEINAHHVELMRAMRDSVTASLEAGRGSLRDSLYIQAELAHMEHDAVVLASERDVLIAQMNELLHRAPAAALPAAPAKLERAPAPELNEAQLEREARENRPEISAAKQHARAEQARARRAARDAYPNFTLSTSYNSMWDMPEHRWMVGIGFALPIQSAARAGAEDEANALQSRYESEAERASDRATSEVYIARQRVREAEHVLDVFERQLLPLARQQVEAARADFTASRATLMDVLGTEKDLRSTELNYEIALADDDRRHAELDHALGRMPASNAEDAR
jgi:outer membrane protein TolC